MKNIKIKDCMEEAELHLKRAEHQVYVSLKYMRTIDVMLNAINRMIESFECIFNTLLRIALKEGKIEEMPQTTIKKLNKIKELYNEGIIEDSIKLYRFLTSFIKSKHRAEEEYRKNLRIFGIVGGEEVFIDIPSIINYYNVEKELLNFTKEKSKKYIEEELEEEEPGLDLY